MRNTIRPTYSLRRPLCVAGLIFLLGSPLAFCAWQQSSAPSESGTAQDSAQPSPKSAAPTTATRRRRRRRPAPATDSAQPQSPSSGGETPAQKAQDQRLLQQQIAASQATKKVNDQQVQEFDANRQKVQNEPRIQDAPGPAQTPLPGTTPTTTPDPQGIQDAPGPAQTNPTPAQPAAPPQG